MRNEYNEQLRLLNNELAVMGGLCENAIALSTKALVDGDRALARKTQEIGIRIEEKEREIISLCMRLLLRQQPVAADLRAVSSALKMVTDMKRIGDQSADIAEIISLSNISAEDNTFDIHDMAVAAIKMVTDSIEAFSRRDTALAQTVIGYDDVVDGCFDRIKHELIRMLGSQEADGEYAVDLLMIAKYFERIGDHAVNIAKWVIFAVTGKRD